jgi:hypothetical protein
VLNTGVNLVQWVGKVITLSVVAGALDCNAGDVLTFQSTHTGTGITDPGGLVEVALSRA